MRIILAAIVIFSAVAAQAADRYHCNAHGAVVTLADGTVYYLGKNCDAAQKGGGTGHWWLAASAYVVDIGGQPRQLPIEIDCNLPACWLD